MPENIDPVFFTLGPLTVRYYGLMYVLSFLIVYVLAILRAKKTEKFSTTVVEDYFFWIILGVVLGSRVGYVLFYDFAYFMQNPLAVFIPFDFSDGISFTGISGLSFHGGVIGFIATTYYFCRAKNISFFAFNDFIVPLIPLGYMFGRIGNFLNHELYGRVTSSTWGMYFPTAPTYELRHPSQLYEAFGEGLVLYVFLLFLSRRPKVDGVLACWFLIGYGAIRFLIEYLREPDAHLGFVILNLSMGQVLCVAMILTGFIIRHFRTRSKKV